MMAMEPQSATEIKPTDATASDESQSAESSNDDSEEFHEPAPDLSDYLDAKQQLASLNERRKQLMETVKRGRDEVEDYLLTSNKKKMRIDGVVCEIKSSNYTPWNEKTILEYVDENGKLDVEVYKSKASVTKQKLTMKIITIN